MSVGGPLEWIAFAAAVAVVLAVDLAAARRSARSTLLNAAIWSGAWVGLGLAFGGWIAVRFGADAGLTYLTAFALEQSLSIDNLFVFALIFSKTGIPAALQHRVLFWGIGGALVMRAVMIGLGVYLLARFQWVVYPFAALLAFAAVRMLHGGKAEQKLADATCDLCTGWVARFLPVSPVLDAPRFLVRQNGRVMATPLLVALIALETTDLVFAVDSIPAVLSVTRDPFLVYTSNIFALFGLRSLYFLLEGVMQRLRYLRTGLALILLFAAAKLLLVEAIEIPPVVSLLVVACIFAGSVAASWRSRSQTA
ncbi:MAG: tellurite resistance protein TerC [Betaproteobacteria bacterium]|jgi:tellurite resistance protein TerC|nr:tellurite resistance protein TerC [Betaproteobacteria bacterium]